MSLQSLSMRHFHPAQNQFSVRSKTVRIIAVTYAEIHSCDFFFLSKVKLTPTRSVFLSGLDPDVCEVGMR